MKTQLLTLLLAVSCSFFLTVISSCTQDKDDARDAYVGTYSISASYICSDCFGNYWSNSYPTTIIVSKGENENELFFSDSYNTKHTVTLDGSNFDFGNFQASGGGIGTGGGSFGSNSINYNLGISTGINCSICNEEGNGTK